MGKLFIFCFAVIMAVDRAHAWKVPDNLLLVKGGTFKNTHDPTTTEKASPSRAFISANMMLLKKNGLR